MWWWKPALNCICLGNCILLSFVVAAGLGLLFNTPRRVIWAAGLLGGLGHGLRFLLLQQQIAIVPATLAGAVFIGLAAIFLAHRVHTPPVVFTLVIGICVGALLFRKRSVKSIIRRIF